MLIFIAIFFVLMQQGASAQILGWKTISHYNTTKCTGMPHIYSCRSYGLCVADWETRPISYKQAQFPVILASSGNYSITTGYYNDSSCSIKRRAPITTSQNIGAKKACLASTSAYDVARGPRIQVNVISGPAAPLAPFSGVVMSLSTSPVCQTGFTNEFAVYSLLECVVGSPYNEPKSPILSFKYSCAGNAPHALHYKNNQCKGSPFSTSHFSTACVLNKDTGFYSQFSCGNAPMANAGPSATASAEESFSHGQAVWLGCGIGLTLIVCIIAYWIYSRRLIEAQALKLGKGGGPGDIAMKGVEHSISLDRIPNPIVGMTKTGPARLVV